MAVTWERSDQRSVSHPGDYLIGRAVDEADTLGTRIGWDRLQSEH